MKSISNMKQLITEVQKLLAGKLKLWDGQTIVGEPVDHLSKKPDIETNDSLVGIELIEPLLKKLVNDGVSFILKTGEKENSYAVEWTIV